MSLLDNVFDVIELEKSVEENVRNLGLDPLEVCLIKEDLEKIPMLKRSDMKKEAAPLYNEELTIEKYFSFLVKAASTIDEKAIISSSKKSSALL